MSSPENKNDVLLKPSPETEKALLDSVFRPRSHFNTEKEKFSWPGGTKEDLKEYIIKKKKERDKEKGDNKNKKIIEKEKNIDMEISEIHSDSTNTISDHDSDQDYKSEADDEDDYCDNSPPFVYIDFKEENINLAKTNNYKTILINKEEGLTDKQMKRILNGERFDFSKKKYVIINLWKVLTKSNLNSFSYNSTHTSKEKFINKIEDKIKWGTKKYLKENLTPDERSDFSLFRDGVVEFLKSLFHKNIKIFITCNADYSFVKGILEHYKINKYIEAIFTPSQCLLPSGRIGKKPEQCKDRRRINKERIFVCIERYVGRLHIKI